ncbi:MAG: hypothetical protein E7562_07915 [Ruminococcaceae bacterium]|nr:hypothetical protein [Oscillospiraceae bacterium]
MKNHIFSKIICLCFTLCLIFTSFSGCESSKTSSKPKTPPTPVTTQETAEHILMSFNITNTNSKDFGNQMWFYRKEKLAEYLLSGDAQVICMQEVKREQYNFLKTALESKYDIIYFARESGGNPEGLAIAYDKAVFKANEQNVFWFSDTPQEQSKGWGAKYFRICVNVLLEDIKTGGKLNVFNVHLDDSSVESRIKSAAMLVEKVKQSEHPAFVAGDFNDKIGSDCYNTISAYMNDCQQTAPDTDNGITYNGWGKIADNKTTPIDFGFVSRDTISPLSFKICRDKWENTNFYSDHYAIKTKVQVTYTVTKYVDAK